MKIIGITGCTGSGTSTLLKAAEALGGLCIDCDKLYHELLKTDAEMLSELEKNSLKAYGAHLGCQDFEEKYDETVIGFLENL